MKAAVVKGRKRLPLGISIKPWRFGEFSENLENAGLLQHGGKGVMEEAPANLQNGYMSDRKEIGSWEDLGATSRSILRLRSEIA